MRWLLLTLALISCASQPRPRPDPNGDPIALLPEKRRVLYWKKGCDTPDEEVAEILGTAEERHTILWRAQCADGRVLRCSYRRVLKCRWEKGRSTSTATSARLN